MFNMDSDFLPPLGSCPKRIGTSRTRKDPERLPDTLEISLTITGNGCDLNAQTQNYYISQQPGQPRSLDGQDFGMSLVFIARERDTADPVCQIMRLHGNQCRESLPNNEIASNTKQPACQKMTQHLKL